MVETLTLDQLMDIRGAIRDWLEKNGYDGLDFDGECSCRLDDLLPCGLTDNALVCYPFKGEGVMDELIKTCPVCGSQLEPDDGGFCRECIVKKFRAERGVMDELKPCPFCGGNAELIEDGDNYRAECLSCPAGVEDVYLTKIEIVAAWNKRGGP